MEFETAGEPKVQFNTTGEPNIRIERPGQQAAAGAEDRQGQQAVQDDRQTADNQASGQQPAQQQTANARASGQQATQGEQQTAAAEQQQVDRDQTASIDRQQLPDTARQRLGEFDPNQPAGEMSSIRVSEMMDKDIVNRQGEEIGTIERVVMRGDRQYVVIGSGGILGLGEREVALPLDRLSMSAENKDQFVLLGMTEDDFAELPEFDMNSVQQVEPNQSVEIRQG